MEIETLKNILTIIGTLVAVFAAGWAAYVYTKNSRLERAKWLANLYEKFYEKENLKKVRDALDCDDEISLEITKLISEESAEFTDYLNFFEFVAFLKKSKQLNFDEINHLFRYYLKCLYKRKTIRDYIERKDYEWLSKMLKEFAEKNKW